VEKTTGHWSTWTFGLFLRLNSRPATIEKSIPERHRLKNVTVSVDIYIKSRDCELINLLLGLIWLPSASEIRRSDTHFQSQLSEVTWTDEGISIRHSDEHPENPSISLIWLSDLYLTSMSYINWCSNKGTKGRR
jgi:hypothetical protein